MGVKFCRCQEKVLKENLTILTAVSNLSYLFLSWANFCMFFCFILFVVVVVVFCFVFWRGGGGGGRGFAGVCGCRFFQCKGRVLSQVKPIQS